MHVGHSTDTKVNDEVIHVGDVKDQSNDISWALEEEELRFFRSRLE